MRSSVSGGSSSEEENRCQERKRGGADPTPVNPLRTTSSAVGGSALFVRASEEATIRDGSFMSFDGKPSDGSFLPKPGGSILKPSSDLPAH
jgi:hypothetical protein